MRHNLNWALSFAAALLLLAVPARAQTVTQKLDRSRSAVHFELTNDLLELSGKFNDYSGTLTLAPGTLNPTKVVLRIDASDVNVAPVENMPFLSPEAVFRSLPSPVINFTSTDITALDRNKFRVRGKVRRGAKEWDTTFVASMSRRTNAASEVFVKMQGSILDFASELPLQFKGSRDQGLIESRLVFVQ